MTESTGRQMSRRSVLGPAVVVLAVGLGAWAVVDQWSAIRDALGELPWWAAPASLLAGACGVYAIFRSWSAVVTDHGIVLTHRQALRIYGIGQAGKYLPGSVWSVLTQAEMVREYGGSRSRMAAASLVALLLSVAVALGLGALVLPISNTDAAERFWYAPLLAFLVGLVLVPAVLNRAVAAVTRLLRRPTDPVRVSGGGILRAVGWAVVANLFFGLHLLALGGGIGLTGARGFLLAIAAYGLAAGLGVLVVIAPAGAGIREVVITVVLGVSVATGVALTIALLSRMILLVVDLGLALSQIRTIRSGRRRSLVFVTRRYPPSVGGMETLAAGVWRSVSRVRGDSILMAYGGGNRGLPWWLLRTWIRLLGLVLRGRVGFVLVGDAPTYAVLRPLFAVGRVPSAAMVMGLDVTYPNPVYRALVPGSLATAKAVIAISEATKEAAVEAGIRSDQIVVLRLGVEPPARAVDGVGSRSRLCKEVGVGPDAVLLVTLGRLVRRKGVRWFVTEVLPRLPANVHYLVAGEGPEAPLIRAAADGAGIGPRVHLLGRVGDDLREDLMAGCDVFVQPNVAVPGDMEGFGLVTIEAAMRDVPVVAADLEGIKDAVVHGSTGILVESGAADSWIATIVDVVGDRTALQAMGRRFGERSREIYSEASMGAELCRLLQVEPDADPESRGI